MASSAPPAVAEFQALVDEMQKLEQQGVESVGLVVAQQRAKELLKALEDQAAAGSVTPVKAGVRRRGKDKDWYEMSDREKEAARTLGWSERAWDRGITRPMDDTSWEDLPSHKRAAAEVLGFRQAVWDNKGVEPDEEEDPEYRCGHLHFEETGRTVPYLLVPSGAARTQDGVDALIQHMRSFFSLENDWARLVIRVSPCMDATPSGGLDESIAVEDVELELEPEPELELSTVTQARERLVAEAMEFVLRSRGCLITPADRVPATQMFDDALDNTSHELKELADQIPGWWIGHHNLRLTEEEVERKSEYEGRYEAMKDHKLRELCKRGKLSTGEDMPKEEMISMLVDHDFPANVIKKHSVPVSDANNSTDSPFEINVGTSLPDAARISPWVSCVLFFEEPIEDRYLGKQVGSICHRLQTHPLINAREGIIVPTRLPAGNTYLVPVAWFDQVLCGGGRSSGDVGGHVTAMDFIGILPPMFICLKEVLAGATLDSSGTIRLSSEAWKDKPQVFKADLIAEYEQLMGAALLTNDNRNANGFGKFKKFPVYGRGAEARVAERNADDALLREDVAVHLEALRKYHKMIQASNLKDEGDARIDQEQLSALVGLDLNATFPLSYKFREGNDGWLERHVTNTTELHKWLREVQGNQYYGEGNKQFQTHQTDILKKAIEEIARFSRTAHNQELAADFCQLLLLLLQFLSVLSIVLKTYSYFDGHDDEEDSWNEWVHMEKRLWLDRFITAIPIFSGILVTAISKARFREDADALRKATDALESELWRYRTRTGVYRREVSSSIEPSQWAHDALTKYVEKKGRIKAASEIKSFQACGSMLSRDDLDESYSRYTRERLRPRGDPIGHKTTDYVDYVDRVLKGYESPFAFVWELWFEFLIFNERDRIDPNFEICGAKLVSSGYFESLLGRLCVFVGYTILCVVGFLFSLLGRVLSIIVSVTLLLCTIGLPWHDDRPESWIHEFFLFEWLSVDLLWAVPVLVAVDSVLTWIAGGGFFHWCTQCLARKRGQRNSQDDSSVSACWRVVTCCASSDDEEGDDEGEPLTPDEKQVSADLYYESRFKTVEHDITIAKERVSHKRSVSLFLQVIISLLALYSSGVTDVVKGFTGDEAAWESLVSPLPPPVAFCVPNARAAPSDAMAVARHLGDDLCTQVMRYARCDPALGCIQFAKAKRAETEATIPACALCAERQPYPTWEQRSHGDHGGEMTQMCTAGRRRRVCAYEMISVAAADAAADCGGEEEVEDLQVAPLTAFMSLVIGLHAYFRLDIRMQSLVESREQLEQQHDMWQAHPSIDSDHLDHKDDLVDKTERAFRARFMGSLDEQRGGDEDDDAKAAQTDKSSSDERSRDGYRKLWPSARDQKSGKRRLVAGSRRKLDSEPGNSQKPAELNQF